MANHVLARMKNGECMKLTPVALNTSNLKISESVGKEGKNKAEDVGKIQAALNNVPPSDGGPNPKVVVSGGIDQATMDAIAKFQKRRFGWSDSRVDPDKVTIHQLRLFNKAPGAASVGPKTDTLTLVYATLPIAVQLIFAAQRALTSAQDYLRGATPLTKDIGMTNFARVNTYFSLDKLSKSQALTALSRISHVFNSMQTAIGHSGPTTAPGSGIFQPEPGRTSGTYAYTYMGGFTRRDKSGKPMMSADDNYAGANLREDAIYICQGLDDMKDPMFVAYNSVHELAHFVGPELGSAGQIEDLSYRHKSNFYSLTPEEAMRTADSYAVFAMDASHNALQENTDFYFPTTVITGGSGP